MWLYCVTYLCNVIRTYWVSWSVHIGWFTMLSILYSYICVATVRLSKVNFFFLLNIVRVLITKLKETHRAETTTYMKAVRATLILIPLLGAQFILFPWRPQECSNCTIYDFFFHIFCHFQVIISSTPHTLVLKHNSRPTVKNHEQDSALNWSKSMMENLMSPLSDPFFVAVVINLVPSCHFPGTCGGNHSLLLQRWGTIKQKI